MRISRLIILAALSAATLPLGACATGGYGTRAGFAYDAAWGDPYWGWYDDYYYPGTGFYVYNNHRRRIRWNDDQRRYWEARHSGWRGPNGSIRRNWRDFNRTRGPGRR
jgi:hypothetical protein